jgi:hypothetical protein
VKFLVVVLQGVPGYWGHHPSLSGPTLTRVLIPSVDPKLQDCERRREVGGERREGSDQEPSLAGGGSPATVVGGTCVPGPFHTPC